MQQMPVSPQAMAGGSLPVVAEAAVAVAMAQGPAAGLVVVDALVGEPALARYHLLPSVRGDLLANANDLIDVISKGVVKININHVYPLKDAAQAHIDLEGRKTTGSIVLTP